MVLIENLALHLAFRRKQTEKHAREAECIPVITAIESTPS
jgi:hypothetical protein